MHILTYTFTYLFELQKTRHPARKINSKNTKSSHKSLPKPGCNVVEDSWPPFPQNFPPTQHRSVKLPVFHRFFPPRHLLNGLSCLVTVGCLGKIGGVFLEWNKGWSLNNPLIRPYFLEVVGIEVLLNSHENKDITNTVLKKKGRT